MTAAFIQRHTVDVTLRDGMLVRLRPIVPEDKGRLLEGFQRLSEQSRYRRFMGVTNRLSPALLAYLTEIDYETHFAWVALAKGEPGEPAVGVARYVRLKEDPSVAEAAVTVADDYQGRGLGTILLEALGIVALEKGIRRFRAYVLAENRPMIEILRSAGAEFAPEEPGVFRVDLDVPERARPSRSPGAQPLARGQHQAAAGTRPQEI